MINGHVLNVSISHKMDIADNAIVHFARTQSLESVKIRRQFYLNLRNLFTYLMLSIKK